MAFLFAVFAIIGSGYSTIGYGLILLVAGIPVYLWLARAPFRDRIDKFVNKA
jgi:hypothetical protein